MDPNPHGAALQQIASKLGLLMEPDYGPSGGCPVQAEGKVSRPGGSWMVYYFRARHEHWSFSVHESDAIDGLDRFEIEVLWPEGREEAGRMSEIDALSCLEKGFAAWRDNVNPFDTLP